MKKYYWILIIAILIILGVIIYESYFLSNPFKEIGNIQSTGLAEENLSDSANLAVSSVVSLIAVGDIMLSRDVATKIKENQDYQHPFLKTADLLKNADLTFGNLESPITLGRSIQTNEMVFRADPEVTEGLNYAGFDVLSLANNHTLNFGEKGLTDTFRYLKEAGIDFVGAGETVSDANLPLIKEVRGMKFAFLAYSYVGSASSLVAFMDPEKMEKAVKEAREKSDFVIVSMHAGTEYQFVPDKNQRDFAQKAVDAGAILVIGHHPHVVQLIEEYNNGYILYSLGNFVFDQMWSQETKEGLVAQIIFHKDGIEKIEFYPVIIEDFAQPRLAKKKERGRVLDRLNLDFENQDFYLIGERTEEII